MCHHRAGILANPSLQDTGPAVTQRFVMAYSAWPMQSLQFREQPILRTRLFSIVTSVVCAGFLYSSSSQAEWYKRDEAIMGTLIRVELWSEDPKIGKRAIDDVMAEMRRIDLAMSPYKEASELSKINREAAKTPVAISRELYDLIVRAQKLSVQTGGAFDITFSSVGYMYDYRKGVKPSDEQIKKALPGINYKLITLDPKKHTIHFGRGGMRIDLGGIAKGYAVDRGIDILRRYGVEHGLVTAGGDSRVLGDHRGRPWILGVRDPRRKDGVVVRMPLVNEAISTSGDYERYFEAGGVRYHHIINPKTGHSASGVWSATVIGPDATTTDGLSTSVFVLGPKDGIALVDKIPGIEAVIIDANGKMLYSAGLREFEGGKNSKK